MADGTTTAGLGDLADGKRHEADSLLAPGEPSPFEIVPAAADADPRLLLICDHASALIPRALGNLGVPTDALTKHIAWDIGAADLARAMATDMGVPLILSGYSRLVIDCNRQLDDPTSIPVHSDGIDIPGNQDLAAEDAIRRAADIFNPYHAAIRDQVEAMAAAGPPPAVVSVHSFTPVFGGYERPWHVGVLWNRDGRLAQPFMEAVGAMTTPEGAPIVVGDNQPYSAQENFGYSVDVHAQDRGLPHMLIEVRQDLIGTPRRARHWARIVGPAITAALDRLEETG